MHMHQEKLRWKWIGLFFAIIVMVVFGMTKADATAESYLGTEKKVVNYVKKQMADRKTTISFVTNKKVYQNTMGSDLNVLQKKLFQDNGKSNVKYGDYLRYHVKSIESTVMYRGNEYKVSLAVKYTSTKKQENAVNKKVKSVVKKLNVSDASDFKKVKAVYEYITKNVVYDNSYQKYSAYNALVEKKAICQGYAALLHRMLRELKLETRIVTGTADGINHAWNIVKIDGKWYNMDVTWDSERDNLLYFLKCTDDFTNHNRGSEFQTKTFLNTYPIAEKCYEETCTNKVALINKSLPSFTMETINGTAFSKKDCANQITIFIFYSGESNQSRTAIENFAKSSLVKDKLVEIVCVNTNGESAKEVKEYRKLYGHKNMTMTYMEKEGVENTNFLNIFAFRNAAGIEASYYPFVFIVDANKRIRYGTCDEISVDECTEVVKALRPEQVENVKLKKRTKKSITLQWNKVSGAKGYYVYDTKTKKIVQTVKKNTAIIKKLTTKTNYSYYVVAYNKNGNGIKSTTIKVKTK